MDIIRISNHSVGALVRSYALTPENVIVWLELAPQHPKVIGAIWASLVDANGGWLRIEHADGRRCFARGLHRRYHRLTTDAPRLAGRARPKLLRLIAPDLCRVESVDQPFGVIAWPAPATSQTLGQAMAMTPGTALAAMLEQGSPFPIRIGWGDYLLADALRRGHAHPLQTGGAAPEGYWLEPAPWEEIISQGIRQGHISLEGQTHRLPVDELAPQSVPA